MLVPLLLLRLPPRPPPSKASISEPVRTPSKPPKPPPKSSWAKQGEANRTTAITDKSLLITFPPSYGSDLQLQQAGRYLHFAFYSTDVPIPTENPALLLIINATG